NFSSLTYTHDDRDRVVTVDNNGTPGAPRVTLTYSYDDAGNVLTVAETVNGAAGATTASAYDAMNRLMRVTQTGGGGSDKRVDFTYNPISQVDTISRFADLAATDLVVRSTYAYDGLNRLTNLVHNNGTTDIASYVMRYDSAGLITELTDGDGTREYTYDHTHQ